MKSVGELCGFDLELAADRFFNFRSRRAVIHYKRIDAVPGLVTLRYHSGWNSQPSDGRPSEGKFRIDHDRTLGGSRHLRPREWVEPDRYPMRVALDSIQMQLDDLTHCKLSLPGDRDERTELFHEEVEPVSLELLLDQWPVAAEAVAQKPDGVANFGKRNSMLASNRRKNMCLD